MTSADTLDLWEAGLTMTPAARAVLLLEAAGHADVSRWPVGRRDQALLAIYGSAPGALAAVAECPACGTTLDLDLDAHQLAAGVSSHDRVTVELGGYRVTARPLSAVDVATLDPGTSVADQRVELLVASVIEAEHDGAAIDARELPEDVAAGVERAVADADPAAELELALVCADCGARWTELLDPVRFAWSTVEESARTLATDVHTLAHAYGWSEQEILELSPFRRHLYLSAVQS